MAKVSIIIPTYNRCKILPRAVESARQAGSDIEIIVVDDASVDATPDVCAAWSDVRYIRTRRRLGVGGTRNLGLIASTSEYVSFLDDDDMRLPGSVDAQVELLAARPEAGMIYGQAFYGDEECRTDGTLYPQLCPQGDIFRELLRWNFIPCPTVVFRRACLSRIGLLDEAVAGVDDWDLWVRLAELYQVIAVEQPVAIWRRPTLTSNQVSARPERMHRMARRLHREKWLHLPRALETGDDGTKRRALAQAFAERETDQLIWEAAERIKTGRLRDFSRVTYAMLHMYPLTGSKKIFRASTWRFLKTALRRRRHGES